MAINSLPQAVLSGSNSVPLWKRLGYKSYQEYVNATSGAQGGKTVVSPTDSLLDRYKSGNLTGGLTGKTGSDLVGSVVSPPSLSDSGLGKYLDPNIVGVVGGIGGVVGGGARGGVTDEGVIVGGSAGNLEKFPTIGNSGVRTPSPTPTPGGSASKPSSSFSDKLPSGGLTSGTVSGATSPSTGSRTPTGSTTTTGDSSGASASPSEEASVPENSGEFGAKYQGNDFLEWYKANYGTDFDPNAGFSRNAGMSDVDWAIGNSLYNSYLTGRNLENEYNANRSQAEERYNTALDALNTNKRNAQQNASITLDKLKKYLPTQIKAQGLGGLGVSESSLLQAYNNYQNNMGEIEGNYNTNKSTIDTNREATLTDLQRAYQDTKTDLDIAAGEKSQGIFEQYKQADKQAKDAAYSDAYGTLAGSDSASVDDLMKYVEQFRGRVSNDQYNTLVQQAQQVAQANLSAQQRVAYEDAYNALAGNTSLSENELLQYVEQFRGKVSDEQFSILQQRARQTAQANVAARAEQDRLQAYNAIVGNVDYMLTDPGNFADDGRLTEEGRNRMLQYLEQNKDALGEQTYNAYKSQIESMNVYTEEQKRADEQQAQADKDKRIITGQESIEYGGKYYQLQSEVDSNANEIRHNNDFKDQLKKLGYTDPFDKNIPNGTTLTFKSDATGKNRVGWEDFMTDLSDWRNWIPFYGIYNQVNNWGNFETRTMTYYNGKWYFSSEV